MAINVENGNQTELMGNTKEAQLVERKKLDDLLKNPRMKETMREWGIQVFFGKSHRKKEWTYGLELTALNHPRNEKTMILKEDLHKRELRDKITDYLSKFGTITRSNLEYLDMYLNIAKNIPGKCMEISSNEFLNTDVSISVLEYSDSKKYYRMLLEYIVENMHKFPRLSSGEFKSGFSSGVILDHDTDRYFPNSQGNFPVAIITGRYQDAFPTDLSNAYRNLITKELASHEEFFHEKTRNKVMKKRGNFGVNLKIKRGNNFSNEELKKASASVYIINIVPEIWNEVNNLAN